MAKRKLYVEHYNKKGQSGREILDPSNLYDSSHGNPNVSSFSCETVDVFIVCDYQEIVNEKRWLKPSPLISPIKDNLSTFSIYEEKDTLDDLFIAKIIDTLYWFGYRYCQLNFYSKHLTENELLLIKEAMKDKADIKEYKNGWEFYLHDNINSNNSESYGAKVELQMEKVSIPRPKRNRALDFDF